MSDVFIEVEKISNVREVIEDGTGVKNPMTRIAVKSKFKLMNEAIKIDEIRSFRPWSKTRDQELELEGDVTKVFFHGANELKDDKDGSRRRKQPEMLIHESFDSFAARLKTTRIENG